MSAFRLCNLISRRSRAVVVFFSQVSSLSTLKLLPVRVVPLGHYDFKVAGSSVPCFRHGGGRMGPGGGGGGGRCSNSPIILNQTF